MMQGNVVMLHLLLRVPIGAQSFTEAVGEFVIDTGFTGHLMMPTEEVEILKLPFVEDAIHILADGQNVLLKKYTAEIQWDGQEKAVKVIAGGDRRKRRRSVSRNIRLITEPPVDALPPRQQPQQQNRAAVRANILPPDDARRRRTHWRFCSHRKCHRVPAD